jgi:hypothetical protein
MQREEQGARRREQVARTMAGVAAGRAEAIAELFDIAAPPVRQMVLSAFRRSSIWVHRDQLDDIVRDLVIDLVELAPSWRADGGAMPWNWARQRLVAGAFARLGNFCDDLDESALVETAAPSVIRTELSVLEVFGRLAREHGTAAVLRQGLEQCVSRRDQTIWLEFMSEKALGNTSPAVTVAQNHGMTPPAVRKVVQRVRARLNVLVERNGDYAELSGIPGLAA